MQCPLLMLFVTDKLNVVALQPKPAHLQWKAAFHMTPSAEPEEKESYCSFWLYFDCWFPEKVLRSKELWKG